MPSPALPVLQARKLKGEFLLLVCITDTSLIGLSPILGVFSAGKHSVPATLLVGVSWDGPTPRLSSVVCCCFVFCFLVRRLLSFLKSCGATLHFAGVIFCILFHSFLFFRLTDGAFAAVF